MSEKTPKENKFPFPIEIDEQTAAGSYANIFMANHTENEFFMDFAFLGPGAKKVKVHSRVIVTPRQMERFAMMINESVRKYEEVYGPISPKKPVIN